MISCDPEMVSGTARVGVDKRRTARDMSVIKPDAAAIKRRRFGAKPWRVHEDSATEPERVSHTPRGGGVALAARIALVPFSSPVMARFTDSSLQ